MIQHCCEGREVLGQLRPLAPGRRDIPDRIPEGARLCLRGRPILEVRLKNGGMTAHCASVQSLA